MELGLTSKVVLITGGSSGIGKVAALKFLEEGAHVAICGRNRHRLDAAVVELEKTGGQVRGYVADMDVTADISRLVQQVVESFGTIDVAVSNAGTHVAGTIEAVSASLLEQHFHTKVLGLWELARQVIPHMRTHGGGRIIAIIGQAGKVPGERVIASSIVNIAQHALIKSLADYVGRDNILVNAVCPSRIASPLTEHLDLTGEAHLGLSLEQQASGWGCQVPLGRWGVPEDIANAVLYLASERAGFVCGTNIDVDGGYQRRIL